jgi:hypothetical protein
MLATTDERGEAPEGGALEEARLSWILEIEVERLLEGALEGSL